MYDIARYTAVKVLTEVESSGAYSNIRLNYYFNKHNMKPIDRSFTSEILYGTLRWKLKIDFFIQKFLKMPINKMDLWTLNILRISAYQIFHMDRVPDFAVVNQGVELSKSGIQKNSSLVNAVLRNFLKNKNNYNIISCKNPMEKLSIEYSHPLWLVQKLYNTYGEEFAEKFMEKNNIAPQLTIRANTLKGNPEELKLKISDYCKDIEDGNLKNSLILKGFGSIERSKEFNEGYFFIQDESSMLSVEVLDPRLGDTIMDLCSAPGGKSTYMAELMHNNGKIIAFDIHEHKLKLLDENTKRLGIDIVETKLKDATIFMKEYENFANKVFVDAPCSGLGLLRKKPEIRWNVKPNDIKGLEKIQYKILINASRYVKKGGYILYSTCTITKEENENLIDFFLENNQNFEAVDISDSIPKEFYSDTCKKGYLKLFPHIHNTDGFFIVKLKRKW